MRIGTYRSIILGTALALVQSGCAGRIYLNSPSLQKSTADVATSLPSEKDALQPFDDQVTALNAFAAQEDRGVALYWVEVRDAHFARLIARDRPDARTKRIDTQIGHRLYQLTGSASTQSVFDPAPLIAGRTAIESFAASQRRNYLNTAGADRSLDLSCSAVVNRIPAAEADRLAASSNALENQIGQLTRLCISVAVKQHQIEQATNVQGEIGEATRVAAEDDARVKTSLSDRAAELQAQIKAADTFADSGSVSAGLEKWLTGMKDILDDAAAGAKVVGWKQASDAIAIALKTRVCASTSVAQKVKDDAKCNATEPTSTSGRVQATWGLAKALTQVADANAPARRSIQWLVAAKAIVAAEQADAQLLYDQTGAKAVAERRRRDALVREAEFLERGRDAAAGRPGDCQVGAAGGTNGHCQFATYVDAWNEGRIPAQILEYRPIQIDRIYAVQRARVTAQKQHALASAGALTLRDAGAGGLTAAIVAQALFDAAILSVGIGGL